MNEEEFYGGDERKSKRIKIKKKKMNKQTKLLNNEAAQKHNYLIVRRTIA